MNIDNTMKELAEYIRLGEEVAALKAHMTAQGVDVLSGTEHKATYKAFTSSRIDTTTLKKEHPDIATAYTKTTTAKRFTFA